MKKFLSLVLALVMTMSLVTISAGAAEYKDLTDKNEIKYSEAVAVLNKIGIITGYEDGSFKPTNNLTRGAAAKIIVSLMIGSEAANALVVNAAPYKDVPASNTFASYIAYCKTAGYISGYADGTFRPSDPLTGYAFSKMLLGALGYKSDVELFTGSGWTMNVARIANVAGLFKGISGFAGNTAVTREVAAQLSLNTLKATTVEYSGDKISVSGSGSNVTVDGTQRDPVPNYSNTDYESGVNNGTNKPTQFATMQFVEEHFPDLKLNSSTDGWGRPANQWAYKNVSVGKFAVTPDFTFTAKVGSSSDTNTVLENKLGLKGYTLFDKDGSTATYAPGDEIVTINGLGDQDVASIADIANSYTANGTTVELYMSDTTANQIQTIVVLGTQVMQVNRVTSSAVTLKKVENTGVAITTVEETDDCWTALKDLKADDFVVVTPLYNGTSYDAGKVFVPTTVTGNITNVAVKSNTAKTPTALTIGGTEYKLSNNWTAADGQGSLTANSVSSTVQTTIYLDSFGYAIYAKDVKATTSYFIYDEMYSNVVDNKIISYVQGYDLSGNAVSLNFGPNFGTSMTPGAVYAYKNSTKANTEFELDSSKNGVTLVTGQNGAINANTTFLTVGGNNVYFAADVKFIFNGYDSSNTSDLTTVSVKTGSQKVTGGSTNNYTVVMNDAKSKIIAVVVTNDHDLEISQNVLYVQKETSTEIVNGKTVSRFTGYVNGDEIVEKALANVRVANDSFYTYTVDANNAYTLKEYNQPTGKATSVISNAVLTRTDIKNNAYLDKNKLVLAAGGTLNEDLNFSGAKVVDLTSGFNYNLGSIKDMAEQVQCNAYSVSIVYNNSTDSSTKGRVQYVYITGIDRQDYVASNVTDVFYNADCTDAVIAGDNIWEGQVLYTRGDVLKSVTAVTNAAGGSLSVVKAPTETTGAKSVPVYSFIVTGSGDCAVTKSGAVDWFATGAAARVELKDGSNTATGIYATITASVPFANATSGVTWTVTLDGTADAAGAADKITFSCTNAANLDADLVDTGLENCSVAALVVTVTANSVKTAGTFTVSADGVTAAAAVPTMAYVRA